MLKAYSYFLKCNEPSQRTQKWPLNPLLQSFLEDEERIPEDGRIVFKKPPKKRSSDESQTETDEKKKKKKEKKQEKKLLSFDEDEENE